VVDAVIEFTNVGLRYGQGPEILRDLSFRIEPGSFHFLTGPSGSGKTSLLKILLLSLRPSTGKVKLFGRDVSALDQDSLLQLRRHIGIVFQEFRLLEHLTTFENVALPLRVLGQPESQYRENVTELLEWVGLGERMHALPALLSGGEKQRAAIARAVIGRPDILLADEPTGNVDPELSLRLVRLFAELNKMGTTIILATHELPLLDNFPFPRMMLDDGRVSFRD
jgi:cell division transport system ATP-binding protein